MQVITAAVNKLHERARFAAIRKIIVNYLDKLGILENQIFSLASDNESNVLKVMELERSDFALPENFAYQNDEGECDLGGASDDELWREVITFEHAVYYWNS